MHQDTIVRDWKKWQKETRMVPARTADGKLVAVCSFCKTSPRFFGWCSGRATWACNCAVLQEEFERGY